MDREKMIQELIQKRINSNNQIKKDMEYISLYKKKKERLATYNKHQNSLMEKVQTLSEQIEKQKETKKESELKAYEEALEKLSIEKERYERIKAEQENKLKAFEETMNQKYEILYNKWQNYYGEDKKVDRKLKKEYEKFYHLSDKKIDELREKTDGVISKAEERYEQAEAKAEAKKPMVVLYEEKLQELEKVKAEALKLERGIEEDKNTYDKKSTNISNIKSEIKEQTYKEFEVYKNNFAFYCVIKNNFLAPIIKSIYNKK